MNDGAGLTVTHDQVMQKFYVVVEEQYCELDYVLAGGVMTITHTGVPVPVAGRGIASALVRSAMDTARVEGWKVIPACSYAVAWISRHPEYAGLRA